MPLAPHMRLGPYEVITLLGSGGMGEVYRAHDTRLGRDVALKVLPSDAVAGEEERQRLEREARTISKLAHPNVCPLYDVGREGDTQYLVMELLEGETLANRLVRGRLPMDAALRYGAEIAAALAAAHARGIVHRDLKPGNVMLTPTGARLMDFGLARAFAHPTTDSDAVTHAPSVALTAPGMIVGTVLYMAPEQLQGGTTDAKTDIFALGAVLFEMATGVRAFAGSTEASVMSAVLTHEPPSVSALERATPPAFDRVVRRCLAKDPAARWNSAADLEIQLREIAAGSGMAALPAPASRPPAGTWLPWLLVAAASLVTIAALLAARRPAPAPSPTSARFQLWPEPRTAFWFNVENDFLAVSPDGAHIAYIAADSVGRTGVWVRALDALDARRVGGTTGARSVFWSADGRSIGFVAAGRMQRVGIVGGAATPICDVTGAFGVHASWGRNGEILFNTIVDPSIYRVAESGGKPVHVLSADTAKGDFRATMPKFLPDGRRFLFDMIHTDGTGSIMYVAPGEKPRELMKAVSRVDFTEPDRLLYVEEGTLFARRFDWKRGRVLGGAVPVADTVGYFLSNGSASYATSNSGTLVYQPASSVLALQWVDRTGREQGGVAGPGGYLDLRLSPEADRLLFSRALPKLGTFDVWLYDLSRGTETRLTSSTNSDFGGLWLPGGREIVYSSRVSTMPQLVRSDLETGRVRTLTGPGGFQIASDVSPDGRTLLYWEGSPSGEAHLWSLPLGGGAPARVLPEGGGEQGARFSPDGRWIVYRSQETGSSEAYVTAFPGPGRRIRLSTQGAQALCWPRGSNEILYLDSQRRLISVPVRIGASLELGTPRVLFTVTEEWVDFDATADGSRILVIVHRTRAGELPLTVVTHWPRSLPR